MYLYKTSLNNHPIVSESSNPGVPYTGNLDDNNMLNIPYSNAAVIAQAGLAVPVQEVIATSDGLGSGIISANTTSANITSLDADYIVTLPDALQNRIVRGNIVETESTYESLTTDSACIGHFKLDEISGVVAANEVGTTGTYINATPATDNQNPLASFLSGKSQLFSGTSDYIETNIAPTETGSLAGWLMKSSNDNLDSIVGVYSSSQNRRVYLGINSAGKVAAGIGSASWSVQSGITVPVTGVPCHVGVTWNDTTVNIYANGTLEGSYGRAGNIPTGYNYYVGATNSSDAIGFPWKGTVDEVVIFDRVLASGEMETLYNGGEAFGFGCKLITPSGSAQSINGVIADTTNEVVLSNNDNFFAECYTSGNWIFKIYDDDGVETTPLSTGLLPVSSNDVSQIETLTQFQYDQLVSPDPTVLHIIIPGLPS